jgi:hypothetical protein
VKKGTKCNGTSQPADAYIKSGERGPARQGFKSGPCPSAQGAEAPEPDEERRLGGGGGVGRRRGAAGRRLAQDPDGGRARAAPPPPRQEGLALCILFFSLFFSNANTTF